MIFFGIPFYKNAEFLKRTLQSLIHQTTQNWEAVVFDDSTDPSEQLQAKEVIAALNHPRIRYSRNPQNLGMAQNWNQVLDAGKPYVATCILHADDQLLPRYVETFYWALEAYPQSTAFFCETVVIDELDRRTFSFADFYKKSLLPAREQGVIHLSGREGINQLIPGNFIFCPTLCFRNTLLGNKRFNTHLKMVTDFDFILSLLLEGKTLTGLYFQPLFAYRRHSQNTTKLLTENLTRFEEEKMLYLKLSDHLAAQRWIIESSAARKMSIVRKNLLFQIFKSLITFQISKVNRYWKFLKHLN